MKLMFRGAAAVLTAALAAFPLAGAAQDQPAGPPPAGATRAQFEQMRETTRAAMLSALSADHRARVQGIVDQVNAGTLTDVRVATQQIDAVLTPDEAKAVVAEHDKAMESMQRSMPQGGPPRSRAGAAGGPAGRRGIHDAGALLLVMSLSPDRLRALRQQMRGGVRTHPEPGPT